MENVRVKKKKREKKKYELGEKKLKNSRERAKMPKEDKLEDERGR